MASRRLQLLFAICFTANALPAAEKHWAFLAPRESEVPKVRDSRWVRDPIDAFILARLEREGISPSREADRVALIRRLSLDLTGLPPAFDEVQAFANDSRPRAYERLVDRLLASPHFGEHWARHWLDLARYADSDGYEKDGVRPYAYLYRDWVIRAINADMPFNEFTIEQIAGDLLSDATLEQQKATGFHRQTLTNKEGGVDQEEFRCRATVDRVNTTAAIWLGLTVGCAECHNHKYDPISQREYYQFYAFFNNTSEAEAPTPDIDPQAPKTNNIIKASVLVATNRATRIHTRGDFLRPGDPVEPGTLRVLHPLRARCDTPDRLDLAHWLVDPQNPLTSRVVVNRIWKDLFGRGLVGSVADFGTRGEQPSNPELLDWLALEFQRLGWSRKALIRLIVTSATYRQSSEYREELANHDPQNILLARQNRLRLSAEAVRDAHLAASGLLTRTIGGPSVRPPLPADIAAIGYANSIRWKQSQGAAQHRRGLYIFFQRTVPYPMLMTFDAPDSNNTCPQRERSNTPLQALTLLNDQVFFECGKNLAKQLDCDSQPPVQRIRHAFQRCLAREPFPEELSRLEKLYARAAEDNPSQALLAVCRTLMNLDEFITRE
jgi:hypothetical protein